MEGWDKKIWKAEPFETDNSVGVTFYYQSPDGEENYPGTLSIFGLPIPWMRPDAWRLAIGL
jgi:aldose 1-epimerase